MLGSRSRRLRRWLTFTARYLVWSLLSRVAPEVVHGGGNPAIKSVFMSEIAWDVLLKRIRKGKCTPFLGAGACAGTLKLGGEIAHEWAEQFKYPLDDSRDLPRIAQYVAIKRRDAIATKELLLEQFFEGVKPPDPTKGTDPHTILASLPLPLYVTTNYDDFMYQALSRRPMPNRRYPVRELCRWNGLLARQASAFDASDYVGPTVERPMVFHLHGVTEVPESIVLTEDDYLDFLVNISRDEDLIPPRIREAFTGTSLLFLGYSLGDLNFRVIFRGLVSYLTNNLQRTHVSVQLAPQKSGGTEEERNEAQAYLSQYFEKLNIQVYWGTCHEFLAELHHRWQEFTHEQQGEPLRGATTV